MKWLGAVTLALTCGCGDSTTAPAHEGADAQPTLDGTAGADAEIGADASGRDASAGSDDARVPDAPSTDAPSTDSPADAPPGDAGLADDGPACGDAACAGGQLCVYVGGGPAQCSPLEDGGACHHGLVYMATCPNLGNQPGCGAGAPRPLGVHGSSRRVRPFSLVRLLDARPLRVDVPGHLLAYSGRHPRVRVLVRVRRSQAPFGRGARGRERVSARDASAS